MLPPRTSSRVTVVLEIRDDSVVDDGACSEVYFELVIKWCSWLWLDLWSGLEECLSASLVCIQNLQRWLAQRRLIQNLHCREKFGFVEVDHENIWWLFLVCATEGSFSSGLFEFLGMQYTQQSY
ncbi:hypothetical protein LOK49_LG14G00131 [Camellia lanceoleosa]|uniref:Uncharacterized protein n=1 Tax=Camellia lanceoleosa TaxID=1840588 RepID=A0ACC0FBS9_9ERIC|nr:hypothetical protein LOK49_LG14G00131 [Camellia lanceoleosa]